MYGSDPKAGLAVFLLVLCASCDDPTRWLEPPINDGMSIMLVLDPDAAEQPMVVLPPVPRDSVVEPVAEMIDDFGNTISTAGPGEFRWCTARYSYVSVGGPYRCLTLSARPDFGSVYHFRVNARGRREARATTTVPGDFRVVSAEASGDPPGTEGFVATWTRSPGSYRYMVSIRGENHPRCVIIGCEDGIGGGYNYGWFLVTRDTTASGTVPQGVLYDGQPPWRVEVYAVDRALYEILVSGTDSDLFPVPPLQNVEGGYGVVGSGVRRQFFLPDPE